MTGNADKDKFQNDQQTEKKLFQAGGPGGPGRGAVKDNIENLDIWEATERIIRKEMNTGTGPEKLKASQLYLKWNELKKVHDKELGQTLPDSAEIKHITQLIATKNLLDIVSTSLNIDFLEAVKLVENHCLSLAKT
jgi:hypothetical protein